MSSQDALDKNMIARELMHYGIPAYIHGADTVVMPIDLIKQAVDVLLADISDDNFDVIQGKGRPVTEDPFPYSRTFWAIVAAVDWKPYGTVGINVERFVKAFSGQ
mgnify:CR=1 FL=1